MKTTSRASPTVVIATYRGEHFAGVDALWRNAFPDDRQWNNAAIAIPGKVAFQPDLLLVALDADRIVGSVMAGYDGHRGWISRIAVVAGRRRQGVGEALVREAERRLAALGCRKVNLQVVASNAAVTAFYARLGFIVEERISMSKLLDDRFGG